jgi:hypothetical protein
MTFLDRVGFRITVRDFSGADDMAALAHAQTLCSSHTILVTQADRTVGKIMKGTVPAPMAPCA